MVGAPQLSQAARSINPIEKTACWRLGWHGCGLYPCGYYYGGYPYDGYYRYGYPYYGYGWRPTWGWGGWGRRWWGWGPRGAGAAIITIVSACRTRLRSRPPTGRDV
jgi:hypothetical protein